VRLLREKSRYALLLILFDIIIYYLLLRFSEKNKLDQMEQKTRSNTIQLIIGHSTYLDELRDELNETLFRSITYNPHHVLHLLFPPRQKHWLQSTPAHTQRYSPSSCNKAELP